MLPFFPQLKRSHCVIAFFASALQAFGMYNIHALSGVTEGGIYGLIALGYSLIYKASGLMTFTQGDIMTLGAFLSLPSIIRWGFPSPSPLQLRF